MNAVFEARSRRGIETTGFCIVFEGSESFGCNARERAITMEAEPQWKNERAISEVHQRGTATIK